MSKSLALGFVYGAAAPVVLACVAATVFVGGNIAAVPLSALVAILISSPVAGFFTLVFGIPLHLYYRRRGITSLAAYAGTGFGLSFPVAAFLLWQEYAGGYENANQALLSHLVQFVSLISGPAAASVFWLTTRPDLQAASLPAQGQAERLVRPAVIIAGLALVGWLGYGTYYAPQPVSRTALATKHFAFDSAKSAALVMSLKSYATSCDARLGYYFITRPAGGDELLFVAQLQFTGGVEIIATNPRDRELRASIYSDTNTSNERSDRLWMDFMEFFPPAVESANALPKDQLPDVPSRGEAGRVTRPWWDWRFHRN